MTSANNFTQRELVYRFGTENMVAAQCTADWVKQTLQRFAKGDSQVVLRASNVCWNNAARAAAPDVGEVERRVSRALDMQATVDSSVDGWNGYVAVRFAQK